MSATEKRKRSRVGVDLIRVLAAEGDRIFSTARARQLSSRVGLKEPYLWEALHHLHRDGWIVSLRRGLYALSPSVPGVTPAHEFEIAMALVSPAAISHWSALHYHGLTDQAPNMVFALTTAETSVPRLRGAKAKEARGGYSVGGIVYRFIQVKPERFFGMETVWVGDARVTVTDVERTLIDGLTMPQYCGDFPEVLSAFENAADRMDLDRIIDYALRLDQATAKRLGWVLEHVGVDITRLDGLRQVPIKGYRTLDPSGPRKGPCNSRWMIQENLPGRVSR